ncbi:histone-lysine N-methyltransferase SETMAR [Trichonephila clavata]|uniref:Histone-lysine N-methyltransferase SETMAR n=1 Tax=Trichonephila clavata TaxID=2740835 RepID=A0A8X6KZA7_TRICU|nr:histone-lysine N-methyltransferase SETMAR [Trichonephila clavata]
MEADKEKIWYILQFDKADNASQVAEIINGVYGPGSVTANYVHFWFRRFRSGMPVVKNIDKITEMIEVDRHVDSRRPGAEDRP